MRAFRLLVLLGVLLVAPMFAQAQEPAIVVADSSKIQRVRLTDGSSLIGRITEARPDSVVVRTAAAEIRLPRAAIAKVETAPAARLRNGEFWAENPNATRLIFGPTGRQLKKGDGYFSSYELFFLGVAGGVSDYVTIGGGMSIFPTGNFFSDNVYYLTPKIGVLQTERLNIAVGGLFGFVGLGDQDFDGRFGILYGVGTAGSRDHSVTFGTGFAYAGGGISNSPLLMFGTEQRVARRLSFVSENYFFPSEGSSAHVISYGVRFFGDKLAVDFALLNNLSDGIFPGIPFLGLVVAF